MSLTVSQLWLYPVKGCRAVAVDTLELDERGPVGNRRFLVTDPQGRMFTQRTQPALARIVTALEDSTLVLASAGHGACRVATADPHASLVTTGVWGDEGLVAEHTGPEAAEWLTRVLGEPAQLLRIGPSFRRAVKRSPGDQVTFADGYPLLVMGEASVAHLNERLIAHGAAAVPMNRFRPNLVIAGGEPHNEDRWPRIRIGEVVLRGMTGCARCIVTTTDQTNGDRPTAEPLRTLATYRRAPDRPQDVLFGRNVVNESKAGSISLGATVSILDC